MSINEHVGDVLGGRSLPLGLKIKVPYFLLPGRGSDVTATTHPTAPISIHTPRFSVLRSPS